MIVRTTSISDTQEAPHPWRSWRETGQTVIRAANGNFVDHPEGYNLTLFDWYLDNYDPDPRMDSPALQAALDRELSENWIEDGGEVRAGVTRHDERYARRLARLAVLPPDITLSYLRMGFVPDAERKYPSVFRWERAPAVGDKVGEGPLADSRE